MSPHLDDAVFACGRLLAGHPGAVVVTVCAGRPRTARLTPWDAAAGFRVGDDVIGARRAEDDTALAGLGARPVWLDFRDDQYGGPPGPRRVAAALARVIAVARPGAVLAPLGLFHRDHRRVSEAALLAWARSPGPAWCLYEDAIYRRVPGLVAARLAELAARGLVLTPAAFGRGEAWTDQTCALCVRKRRAVACYRSQLRALASPGRPGHADALAAERYWRLAGAAPGSRSRGVPRG